MLPALTLCFISLLPFFFPGRLPSWLPRSPKKNLSSSGFSSSSCLFAPATERRLSQQPLSLAQPARPLFPGALRSCPRFPWGPKCCGRASGRGCAGPHPAPSCTPHLEVRGLPDRRGPALPPDAGRPPCLRPAAWAVFPHCTLGDTHTLPLWPSVHESGQYHSPSSELALTLGPLSLLRHS